MTEIEKTYILAKSIHRGADGPEVNLIQEWLCLNGYTTAIDGDFGGGTARAVRKFQAASELPATGVVDPVTFACLVRPMEKAKSSLIDHNVPMASRVLDVAYRYLKSGACEVGGANRGPWVRLFMRGLEGDRMAWCAGFVSTVLKQAGPPPWWRYTSSCDHLAENAKKAGAFIPGNHRELVRPGYIFLVRKTDTDWVHTGLVLETDGEEFDTIEGNSNPGGSREGTSVVKRFRAFKPTIDFVATY